MNIELKTKNENSYKVVKIMRQSGRREILSRALSESEAQRIVESYPNSTRSMVVYYKQ